MDLVQTLSQQYMKPELPEMNVGDTDCGAKRDARDMADLL